MPVQTIRIIFIFAIVEIIGVIIHAGNMLFIHIGVSLPPPFPRPLVLDIIWILSIILSVLLVKLCRNTKKNGYLISYGDYKKMAYVLTVLSVVLLVSVPGLPQIIRSTIYLIGCAAWVMSIQNVKQPILRKYISIGRAAILALLVFLFAIQILPLIELHRLLVAASISISLFLIFLLAVDLLIAYFLPTSILKCVEKSISRSSVESQ